MKQLEPWYVTGLCDGDGTFTFSRNGNSFAALYFAVKLTQFDRPLLERLQEFFGGTGTIYGVKPITPKSNSGWTKRSVYYRVTHIDDLRSVVDHFDSFPPQGRRCEVYAVWRELYEIRLAWLRKKPPVEEMDRFNRLLEHLSELSPRNQAWIGS